MLSWEQFSELPTVVKIVYLAMGLLSIYLLLHPSLMGAI